MDLTDRLTFLATSGFLSTLDQEHEVEEGPGGEKGLATIQDPIRAADTSITHPAWNFHPNPGMAQDDEHIYAGFLL